MHGSILKIVCMRNVEGRDHSWLQNSHFAARSKWISTSRDYIPEQLSWHLWAHAHESQQLQSNSHDASWPWWQEALGEVLHDIINNNNNNNAFQLMMSAGQVLPFQTSLSWELSLHWVLRAWIGFCMTAVYTPGLSRLMNQAQHFAYYQLFQ